MDQIADVDVVVVGVGKTEVVVRGDSPGTAVFHNAGEPFDLAVEPIDPHTFDFEPGTAVHPGPPLADRRNLACAKAAGEGL